SSSEIDSLGTTILGLSGKTKFSRARENTSSGTEFLIISLNRPSLSQGFVYRRVLFCSKRRSVAV
ncbi:hypothetical protein RB213_008855, partial [Colletotrichum asianum]